MPIDVTEETTRRIVLGGEAIEYRLVRARRRSIGLVIGLDGVTVRAPRSTSLRTIETLLVQRETWITTTLVRWRARRRDVLPRDWVTGDSILIGGQLLTLEIRPGRDRSVAPDLFHCRVRHPAAGNPQQVARFVDGWLREEALRRYTPLAHQFALRVASGAPQVKISNARTAWGSCTHGGVIRLSRRLVQLPQDLARYIVAHEVAHLVEMNHSVRFWSLVETLHPGHQCAEKALDDWVALLSA